MKINKIITAFIALAVLSSFNVLADVKLGKTPDEKLMAFTKCSNIKIDNVMTGYVGKYTFMDGFSEENRTGLINRKIEKVSNTCILPSLQPQQIVYLEVDTKAFKAAGSSNDWTMQCLRSDNPSAGALTKKESNTEAPYKVSYLSGKDMMLHCGHSEKHADDCAEGSNSSRSGKWKKKLKKSGKTMISVLAQKSTLAPAVGEKVYCQYYNKKTKKSLFGFEYIRAK